MKRFKNFTIAAALLLLGAVSAKAQDPDVYIGGIKDDQGAIWTNEVPEIFNARQINCIEMVGEDFYYAGLNIAEVPVIWKNEEVLYTLNVDPLSFGTTVTSMAINGDDVYVTTTEINSQNQLVGKVWINGEVSEDYVGATELNTIICDGDDIYVAGGVSGSAMLWKNAEPLYTYASSYTGLFCDVEVVDGDVYYVGGDYGANGKSAVIDNPENVNVNHENDRSGIFVWKNDEILYTLGSVVYGPGIEVVDDVVYVSGQIYHGSAYKATLWVDGEPSLISDVWSGIEDIRAHDGDLYLTGFVGNYPELDVFIWKNGEFTRLTSPGYDMGYSIEIVDETDNVEEIENVCNIYPNPADNYILIEGVEFKEAVIYNSLGQLVVTANSNMIDVSMLEPGFYMLKLDNTITRNIIIRH